MAQAVLILIVLLQFTAGISGDHDLYYRVGNDVTLSCGDEPSSETRCSHFTWYYERNENTSITVTVVDKGEVNPNSPRADRLSLSRNLSLVINNISAEDAGRYTCRIGNTNQFDTFVQHLNILTISPSPPDADANTDDEVTLKCSLLKYDERRPCPQNSIRWMDENGSLLLGEGDGFKFNGQTGCDSLLTVKHQSDHNRRYTCQFTERNIVKIEEHYPPVFKEVTSDNNNNNNNSKDNNDDIKVQSQTSSIYYIMLTLRITTLVLMIGITVVVITYRGRKKLPEDTRVHFVADTGGDTVNYENVGHHSAAAALH